MSIGEQSAVHFEELDDVNQFSSYGNFFVNPPCNLLVFCKGKLFVRFEMARKNLVRPRAAVLHIRFLVHG